MTTEGPVPVVAEGTAVSRAPAGVMRGGAIALASRGLGLIASVATGIVTARALGPEGKGTLAFLSAVAALMVRVGSLGLDGSFAHFYLVQRRPLTACVGAVAWMTLIAATIAAIAAEVVLLTIPTAMPLVPPSLGVPFFASAPAFFVLFLVTFIFFALGKEGLFGLFDIAYRLALFVALMVVLGALGGGLTATVWVYIGVSVAFAAIAVVAIGRAVRWSFPFDVQLVREMLASGSRYYAYGLLRYTLCYQAILMGGVVLSDRETGLLAVAVMLGEAVMLFAGSVNLAFYPAVATSVEPRRYTATVATRVAGISALLTLALVLMAQPLIGTLYGAAFVPSINAFVWMAPGYVLLSAEQVTSSYFASRGMPSWVAAVFFGGIVCAGVLAVALGPRFGSSGVAASVGVAQVLVALIIVGRFSLVD